MTQATGRARHTHPLNRVAPARTLAWVVALAGIAASSLADIAPLDRLDGLDTRAPWSEATSARLAALAARDADLARLASEVPGVTTRWAEGFETPVFLRSSTAMLTPAAPNDGPASVVERFVGEHPGLFRCSVGTLRAAQVIRDAQSETGGLRSYWLEQHLGGVPVVGCDLRATLTSDGRLVSIGSTLLELDPARVTIDNTVCGIAEAIRSTASALGATPAELDQLRGIGAARTAGNVFEYIESEPVYVPVSRELIVRGHRITAQLSAAGDRYEFVTIGEDPAPAIVRSITREVGVAATYRIFPGESPTPMQPASPLPNGDQPQEAERIVVTIDALDPVASPEGWVDPTRMTTIGNNIIAQADFIGNNDINGYRPDAGKGLIFDYPFSLIESPSESIDAAITQAFYTANWFHDVAYGYGFTEGFGAYQTSNFGRGGVEGDAVLIDVLDGSATNNARFISNGEDGSPGRVELFPWVGASPSRDGAVDNHIVVHEMAHGVTERILRGLDGIQGRSMGEGWSDYFALSLLTDPTLDHAKTFPFAPYIAYAFGDTPFENNYYFGLRRFPYSTDMSLNPLTFADIDPSQFSTPAEVPISPRIPPGNPGRVHQVGEFWCATLWECRSAFIQAEGPEGAVMFDRIVVDSLKVLTTSTPDMVMARDAILIADLVRHGGAHTCDLWTAFAKRGLGIDAFSPSSDLGGIQESFVSPALPRLLTLTTSTGTLVPGPDTHHRVGVDPGCADPGSIGAVTAWVSMNGGAFMPYAVTELTPGRYDLLFPTLLCGDVVQFYFELETDSGAAFLPEAGAAASFIAEAMIDPELDYIRSEDREPFDFFGADIALEDGVLVVGAWQDDDTAFNAGAAYIFEPGDGGAWTQRAKLLPQNKEFSISFGYRVAISGDLTAVSALTDSTRAPGAGAVSLFRRNGSGGWDFESLLTALDGEENDGFGSGLEVLDDGTVYVGAFGNDTQGHNAGAVYAYSLDPDTGWKQLRRFIATDGGIDDRFGEAVAAEGDLLIVGAPGEAGDSGQVYIYRRTALNQWTLEQRITPAIRRTGAEFGASVDLDGDRLIVGSPGDTAFFQSTGAAYIFERDPDTGEWTERAKLEASFQRALDEFGRAVSIEGDLAICTAPRSDLFESDGGAAFLYRLDGEDWAFYDRVVPHEVRDRIQFGSSAVINNGIAAVGTWLDGEDRSATGSVSVYRPVEPDCDSNGMADLCDIASGSLDDLNADGVPDRCACLGDLNGDRVIDTADLGALISRYGSGDPIADLNLDGVVDQADIGILLQGFRVRCVPAAKAP